MTENPSKRPDPTDEAHPEYDSAKDPTHPLYDRKKEDVEQETASSADGAYKVGPGRPPREYTWKKGSPSPNPKGRPKKVPSMKPDLRKAFENALNEKVAINKDKKQIVLTKAALGMEQLANQLAKGDRYARRDFMQIAERLGVDLYAKDVITDVVGLDDQAIVDAALRRMEQQAVPVDTVYNRVKAPADLIDDDVNNNQSDLQPDTAPQKKAKKQPDPILDEHGNPLPVSDIRYIREINSRRLAQHKKNQGES